MTKIGKPFVMPPDIEIKILNYIISKKGIGFRLTVNQVRSVAFKFVEAAEINHPFNRESQMGGWNWWDKLKERCNLSLRTPQNISMCRAPTANRTLLSDFHYKV
jgi:hypothetical protein